MVDDKEEQLQCGWLYKWTNYLKGYKKRWFVVENGLFSYYSNANTVSHSCMGTIDLSTISISAKNSQTSFLLRECRGRTYHLKALTSADKNRWLDILRSAKTKTMPQRNGLESDSYSDDISNNFQTNSMENGPLPLTLSQTSANGLAVVPQSSSSGWRSFRRFRRRTRQHPPPPPLPKKFIDQNNPLSAPSNNPSPINCIIKENNELSKTSSLENAKRKKVSLPVRSTSYLAISNLTKSGGVFEEESEVERSPKSPARSSQRRRRTTLGYCISGENQVAREFHDYLTAVDSSFDLMVIESDNFFSEINKMTHQRDGEASTVSVSLDNIVTLGSNLNKLIQTCQKTMAAWSTSMDWFHRRLSSECDKNSRLERTIEQLAKQHRNLERKLWTSYGSLTDTLPQKTRSSSVQRDIPGNMPARIRLGSTGSADDVFYDTQSRTGSTPFHTAFYSPENRTPSPTLGRVDDHKHPETILISSGSLVSLVDVDESSGSSCGEDDNFIDDNFRYQTEPTTPNSRLSTMNRNVLNISDIEVVIHECCSITNSNTASSNCDILSGVSIPASTQLEPLSNSSQSCIRKRRTSIPPRPRISLNLWGVLKNCIGKELSRIPLPVNFNEPISFLQRVTEDLTYSHCLDEAAKVPTGNVVDRLAWIAAFSVSCYATTAVRTCKPFNPLLGETYECDRSNEDYGWRSLAEQVSHHPPVVAQYCESTRYGWKFWQEFTVNSKFRGKYLSLIPKGTTHLMFKDGHHYSWCKVNITVHNIIIGRLWMENHGETVIRNHNTQHTCQMRYDAHSYFSRDSDRRVTGLICDPSGTPMYSIKGTWDSRIDGFPVTQGGSSDGPYKTLLTIEPLPPNAESMYNFSRFAVELNEPEDGVAPTDSRLRPDQRLMEEGKWDEANIEKERLEAKQRLKRRVWEIEVGKGEEDGIIDPEIGPPYKPVWFTSYFDELHKEDCHMFNGSYWIAKTKGDWSRCPNIF